ncbi:MAG TPA: hypothetical protein VJB57_19775 [Dehalococcoidia bacterium]|nr:hypothetical protein [Dehalococcoidia bacterium]
MTIESRYEVSFICNREVRWIPRGWQHPRDEQGRLRPLLPNGSGADPASEMPAATGPSRVAGLEIAAYETTTEGTPLSPSFPDTPEGRLDLVNWCAENATTFGRTNKADAEAWAAILFGEESTVSADGRVTFG